MDSRPRRRYLPHFPSRRAGAGSTCQAGDPPLLFNVVVKSRRPAESPPLSAVCFSSRWIHPRTPQDPWNTFQAAAAFHATNFLWVYSLDRQAVQRLKLFGGTVYLAINSRQPDEPDKNERLRGRILDLDGNRVTAPWMRSGKGNFWGCANSPRVSRDLCRLCHEGSGRRRRRASNGRPADERRGRQVGWLLLPPLPGKIPRLAQDARQPGQSRQGGNSYRRRGWSRQASRKNLEQFDYREYLKSPCTVGDAFAKYDGGPLKRLFVAFQEDSVRAFFRNVRQKIDAHAGRHVPFSSNNYAGNWQFPYDMFEMGTAELPKQDANAKTLYQRFAEARRHGKAQVFTVVPKTTDDTEVAPTRRAIAMCYACGGHLLVPWDVYIPAPAPPAAPTIKTLSDHPRYFGKPEQYADLYKLVRDHCQLFDGYEDAAFLLQGLTDARYSTQPPISLSGTRHANATNIAGAGSADDVAAIARAVPGKPEVPIVIHLVDWRAAPQPMTARLLTRRFVRQGSLQAELLRPGNPAIRLECHTTDTQTSIEIPRLDPWGIVVVTPSREK